jgi:hypothetical protein
MHYPAGSSGVSNVNVMPDLIRHPVCLLDSGFRRNDNSRQATGN